MLNLLNNYWSQAEPKEQAEDEPVFLTQLAMSPVSNLARTVLLPLSSTAAD